MRFWPGIWYINLSSCFTDQVQLLSRLTYILLSHRPPLKFSFPNPPCAASSDNDLNFSGWICISIIKISSNFWGAPLFCFCRSYRGMPLENLLGPVGILCCLSNTFRMLFLFCGFSFWHRITCQPARVKNKHSYKTKLPNNKKLIVFLFKIEKLKKNLSCDALILIVSTAF